MNAKKILFILTGLNLLNYIDRYVMNGVLIPIQSEFALSDAQVGQLNTSFMLGYFVTAPFFGYLGDRKSRKVLVAGGVIVAGIASIMTGFAATLWQLLFARILIGVGEASYSTIGPTLIADAYPEKKRNWALTIFYTALPLGAALGYFYGGQMAALFSWRSAFHFIGIPTIIFAFSMLFVTEPKRGQADQTSETVDLKSWREYKKLFQNSKYLLAIAGYVAYTFAMGALSVWAPIFLHRYHEMNNAQATFVVGAMIVGTGILGTIIGGYVASKLYQKTKKAYDLVLGISLLLSAPLVFAGLYASSLTMAIVCFSASMFTLFLSTGPINTVLLDSVPPYLRASAMAFSIFAIHLFGDLWSPEIIGHISDNTESLKLALNLLPAVLFIGALFWLAPLKFSRPITSHYKD